MGTRMASRRRAPPTAASSYRFNENPKPLLGWSFNDWTCPKMRAIFEYYDYKIDESQGTASKTDLMGHLDLLIRQVGAMTVNDRDSVLRVAGLGPRPQYDPRLAEVLRYVLQEDDHDQDLQEFPYVSEMLELGPPPAKSPFISEYEAVARDYRIYLDTYRIADIEDDTTFARIYHKIRRPQKTYSAEGRDSFIRFALYRSLLKPENLEAFLMNNDEKEGETSNEAASTEYPSNYEFSMTPSPVALNMSSQTNILYISSGEDDLPEDLGLAQKSTSDEPVAIPRLKLKDKVSASKDKPRSRKRKRVDDSTDEAESLTRQDSTRRSPTAQPQPSGPCITCNRSFSPTPDGYTTETMRCCPACLNTVKVVKEPYHVPTICKSTPKPPRTSSVR